MVWHILLEFSYHKSKVDMGAKEERRHGLVPWPPVFSICQVKVYEVVQECWNVQMPCSILFQLFVFGHLLLHPISMPHKCSPVDIYKVITTFMSLYQHIFFFYVSRIGFRITDWWTCNIYFKFGPFNLQYKMLTSIAYLPIFQVLYPLSWQSDTAARKPWS